MKFWKFTGLTILGLVLLIGICLGLSGALVRWQIKSEIAAIKAKGQPLTVDDLEKENIPDSVNAAVAYTNVAKTLKDPAFSKDFDLLTHFRIKYSGPKPDEAKWTELRQALKRVDFIFPRIESAASRPKFRIPINRQNPSMSVFPVYSKIRNAERLLGIKAVVDAKDGKMDSSVYHLALGIRTCEGLKDEPMLFGFLARIAMESVATHAIQDTAQYGHFNEAQTKKLFDALDKVDMHQSYVRMLQGERVVLLGTPILSMGQNPLIDTEESTSEYLKYRMTQSHSKLVLLTNMRQALESSNLSYRDASTKDIRIRENRVPFYAPFAKALLPVYGLASAKRDEAVANITGTQVFLALLAYKDRYGNYPATLGELRSKMDWEIPSVDPFSGRDFVYHRQGKGFLLYSLGINMKDESGKRAGATVPYDQSDIVWSMER